MKSIVLFYFLLVLGIFVGICLLVVALWGVYKCCCEKKDVSEADGNYIELPNTATAE